MTVTDVQIKSYVQKNFPGHKAVGIAQMYDAIHGWSETTGDAKHAPGWDALAETINATWPQITAWNISLMNGYGEIVHADYYARELKLTE